MMNAITPRFGMLTRKTPPEAERLEIGHLRPWPKIDLNIADYFERYPEDFGKVHIVHIPQEHQLVIFDREELRTKHLRDETLKDRQVLQRFERVAGMRFDA